MRVFAPRLFVTVVLPFLPRLFFSRENHSYLYSRAKKWRGDDDDDFTEREAATTQAEKARRRRRRKCFFWVS